MPFCPKCKYEYVEGIESCPDCDLKLVQKLHPDYRAHEEHPDLLVIATYMFPQQADMAKLHLDMEGIDSMLVGDTVSRMRPGLDPFPIRLMVREEDAERAWAILNDKVPE